MDAADFGGIVVEDSSEADLVVAFDRDLFIELLLQALGDAMPGIDVAADAERELVVQPRVGPLARAAQQEPVVAVADHHIRDDLPVLRRLLGDPTHEELLLALYEIEDLFG